MTRDLPQKYSGNVFQVMLNLFFAHLDVLAPSGIMRDKRYEMTQGAPMDREWFGRLIQVTAITLTMAAIFQELEKPEEEREWHGTIAKYVPYDFRLPTLERLKETYWNPYDSRLLTRAVFGIGWTINFYALMERLRIFSQDPGSEEDFLMPTKTIKELLAQETASDWEFQS